MAVFKYEGVSASWQKVSGVVEAFDNLDALEKARQQCRVVDKIVEVRETPDFLKTEIGKGAVKEKVIAIMCSQFATILVAGMSMAKCVQLVAEQTTDKRLKPILVAVAEDVAAGHSLADSFESKGGEKLPVILYETIRAGELSGNLNDSFETLHKYFDKSSKTKAKVVQTLTYPAFVIVIAIVVVIVMMVAVIPTFKEILVSNGSEMPAMTQVLISTSDFISNNILWMILVVAAAVLGIKLWTKSEAGHEKWATFQLHMLVLGKIRQLSNAAMYANTMSVLLKSGLQVVDAVRITAKVLDSYIMARDVDRMAVKLEEGRRLGDCMKEVTCMPQALIEMTAIGEESGALEQTLATMGAFYDEETDRVTQSSLSKLEPGVLIFIAVFAGYIVVALYMAMFSIYGGM